MRRTKHTVHSSTVSCKDPHARHTLAEPIGRLSRLSHFFGAGRESCAARVTPQQSMSCPNLEEQFDSIYAPSGSSSVRFDINTSTSTTSVSKHESPAPLRPLSSSLSDSDDHGDLQGSIGPSNVGSPSDLTSRQQSHNLTPDLDARLSAMEANQGEILAALRANQERATQEGDTEERATQEARGTIGSTLE